MLQGLYPNLWGLIWLILWSCPLPEANPPLKKNMNNKQHVPSKSPLLSPHEIP